MLYEGGMSLANSFPYQHGLIFGTKVLLYVYYDFWETHSLESTVYIMSHTFVMLSQPLMHMHFFM